MSQESEYQYALYNVDSYFHFSVKQWLHDDYYSREYEPVLQDFQNVYRDLIRGITRK